MGLDVIPWKWLSVTPDDSGYLNPSSAVTLTSDFSEVIIKGPLRKGSVTVVDGRKVVAIIGHDPASPGSKAALATLYVTAIGEVLPVEFHTSNTKNTDTTKWSDWGHRVALMAPTGAIPLVNVDG